MSNKLTAALNNQILWRNQCEITRIWMISLTVEQKKVKEAMNPVTSHMQQQIDGT